MFTPSFDGARGRATFSRARSTKDGFHVNHPHHHSERAADTITHWSHISKSRRSS
jgi:hypothetical protein